RALADELEVHLRAELDLVEEASNAELVARLLEDYEDLVVPAVMRPYVTQKVLVLERIEGRKVDADHGLGGERAHELARQVFRARVSTPTNRGSSRSFAASCRATTGGRCRRSRPGRLWRICNASPSTTASRCRRPSRWSGRRWRRPTRSHVFCIRSSTRSRCSRRTRSR